MFSRDRQGYGCNIDWARCQSIRRALIKAVCEGMTYDLARVPSP
jgi:hypothetical protein